MSRRSSARSETSSAPRGITISTSGDELTRLNMDGTSTQSSSLDAYDNTGVGLEVEENLQTISNDTAVRWNEDQHWEQQSQGRSSILPFVNAFFLTVATVLGTGILGLPVKLAKPGFAPFLVSYFLTFVMQVLVLLFTVEVMQRGKLCAENELAAEHKMIPMEEFDVVDEADDQNDGFGPGASFTKKAQKGSSAALSPASTSTDISSVSDDMHEAEAPDLHTLGRLFLPNKWLSIPFDISVIVHFVSILISYTLAGSLAFATLLNMEAQFRWVIIPFFVVGTTLLISGNNFFPKLFHSGISLATFAKGGLLVLMVVVTARVAEEVNHPITDSWQYIGRPFLIGTVAMGGAVNILPVVFAKIRFRRRDIIIFTWVIIGALFTVWVLNILWCYFLLKTIPQESSEDMPEDKNNVLSLEGAEKHGKPSTVPLFMWVAFTVDIFIMTSISVSYVTVGAGLQHVLDGMAQTWRPKVLSPSLMASSAIGAFDSLKTRIANSDIRWKKAFLYLIFFGGVFIVAFFNPESFLIVLERVTSLALNLEAGAFIVIMLWQSRQTAESMIPMPLPDWVYMLRWAVMAYFAFAVLYDFVAMITGFFGIDVL